MAFKLNTSDTFYFPVVLVSLKDMGGKAEGTIDMQFRRLDLDARNARSRRLGGDIYRNAIIECEDSDEIGAVAFRESIKQGLDTKSADELTDDLLEIVCGWKNVTDDKTNEPVEFSRDALLTMVRTIPDFSNKVNEAYTKAYNGKLKEGN